MFHSVSLLSQAPLARGSCALPSVLLILCFCVLEEITAYKYKLYCVVDADFNNTCFNITFPADERSGTVINSIDSVRFAVVDDDINERFEQLFLIVVEVVKALNPSTIDITRNTTIGIIVDNDRKLPLCTIHGSNALYQLDFYKE